MLFNKKLLRLLFSAITLLGFLAVSSRCFSQEMKTTIKSGELKIKQGDTEFELGGVLMWDYDYFETAYTDGDQKDDQGGGQSELRRASIYIKNKLNKVWQAKLQISFTDQFRFNDDDDDNNNNNSAFEADDAYIRFKGCDYFTLTIGQTKEPFGLEELTGSENITMIDRSMATSAFAPGSRPGLELSDNLPQFTWSIGIFETEDGKDQRKTYALTGRLIYTPRQSENKVFHLGMAGSMRDFNGGSYEIKERAEVHTSEKIVTSPETIADKVNLLGLEAAWIIGSFSLQAEHVTAFIKTDKGDSTSYSGYYLLGSYFITGESREYQQGDFGGPKFNAYSGASEDSSGRRPINMKPKTKYGALELAARYSVLDAESNESGEKAANLTFGINYYINKQVRVMINYISTNMEGDILYKEDKAKAISMRLQYSL